MIEEKILRANNVDESIIEMIKYYENADYEVVFVTGDKHFEAIKGRIEDVDQLKNVHILPFINNMPQYLVNMDLFVGRSGATFLAEVTALGVPCILIPSPYVTANHQEFNARSLTDHGGGILLLERELTGQRLYNEIDRVMKDEQLRLNMQNTSKQLGIPDAAQRLITVMNEIIEKK